MWLLPQTTNGPRIPWTTQIQLVLNVQSAMKIKLIRYSIVVATCACAMTVPSNNGVELAVANVHCVGLLYVMLYVLILHKIRSLDR